ncbi:hypothetical protein HDU97_008793, partial [Phlyctochytrium planicorne]
MHISISVFLLVAAALSVNAAIPTPPPQICDEKKLPDGWQPGKVVAPLVQITQFQKLNPAAAFTCSGTVVVLDGCSFMVKDFTFGGALQTQWYAGIVSQEATGIQVSDEAVHFGSQDVAPILKMNSSVYNLLKDPVVGYSWFSINQLRVFDLANQQVVCTADMPNNNPLATQPQVVDIPKPNGPFVPNGKTGPAATAAVTTGAGAAGSNGKPNGGVVGGFRADALMGAGLVG